MEGECGGTLGEKVGEGGWQRETSWVVGLCGRGSFH